jgi:HSP20 family protein
MGSLQNRNNKGSHSVREHIVNPFLTIQNEVDKALHGFYDLFETKPFDMKTVENVMLSPSMDLVEEKDCYRVEVEMPGMDENDVSVTLNENILTIRGEKSISKKSERKHYISREISYGQYERSITLPQSADGDKISASFKKGMLWVVIPKKAGTKGQSHQIKVQKA